MANHRLILTCSFQYIIISTTTTYTQTCMVDTDKDRMIIFMFYIPRLFGRSVQFQFFVTVSAKAITFISNKVFKI